MAATDSIPYGHTWYVGTMEAAPECAPLGHDIDVDVCVVGGGLAGLTTAREIARRGWSVVVLEAERIGWSASGRNGGFVLPGFAQSINTIVERVGLKRAKELWGLSVDGVEYVRTTIRETAMAGVEPVDGWLAVRRTDNEDALIRDVALLRVAGAQLGDRDFRIWIQRERLVGGYDRLRDLARENAGLGLAPPSQLHQGIDCKRRIEVGFRLAKPAQLQMQPAPMGEHFSRIGLDRERRVECALRRIEVAEVQAHDAFADGRLQMARLQRKSPIETLHGLFLPLEQQLRHAAVAISVAIVGL